MTCYQPAVAGLTLFVLVSLVSLIIILPINLTGSEVNRLMSVRDVAAKLLIVGAICPHWGLYPARYCASLSTAW